MINKKWKMLIYKYKGQPTKTIQYRLRSHESNAENTDFSQINGIRWGTTGRICN